MLAFPDDALLTRLQGTPGIKAFGLAPDLAEATRTPPRSAPALHLSTQLRGSPSELSGPQVQGNRVTAISLALWIRNSGTPERVLGERRVVCEAIDAQLLGWSPDDAVEALYLESQRDLFTHGAWLVTQLIYRANWTYTGTRTV